MTKKTKKEITVLLTNKNSEVSKNFKNKELVRVKSGYARNYLLPNKIGLLAKPSVLEQQAKKQKNKELLEAQKIQTCLNFKLELEKIKLFSLEKRVGAANKIFGTITSKQILELLAEKTGLALLNTKIELPEIKQTGNYNIQIILHPEVIANIQLEVSPK